MVDIWLEPDKHKTVCHIQPDTKNWPYKNPDNYNVKLDMLSRSITT